MSEKPAIIPEVIQTELPDVTLVEMIGVEDDKKVFEFQERERDHIKAFGNTLFKSVKATTATRKRMGGKWYWIRKDGEDVGWESYGVSKDGGTAEVGMIVSQDASGQGIATAAVKALTEKIAPDFVEVKAHVRTDHAASLRVMEKSGYVITEKYANRDWAGVLGATVLRYVK
jgi:RimJ/RimL family protein N-acetyltransferase